MLALVLHAYQYQAITSRNYQASATLALEPYVAELRQKAYC